jgi:hypothetical protein
VTIREDSSRTRSRSLASRSTGAPRGRVPRSRSRG